MIEAEKHSAITRTASAYLPKAFLRTVGVVQTVITHASIATRLSANMNKMGGLIRDPGHIPAFAVVEIVTAIVAPVVGVMLKVPLGNVHTEPVGRAPQVIVTLIVSVDADPPTALTSTEYVAVVPAVTVADKDELPSIVS
jgi:hypothetical protein